ncbi:hypothetical protein LCGC14_2366740, partial [marine sediment metagenome]
MKLDRIADEEIKKVLKPLYLESCQPSKYVYHSNELTLAYKIAYSIAQAQLDSCQKQIKDNEERYAKQVDDERGEPTGDLFRNLADPEFRYLYY